MLRGSDTLGQRKPMFLPTALLAQLPGANNEQRAAGDPYVMHYSPAQNNMVTEQGEMTVVVGKS